LLNYFDHDNSRHINKSYTISSASTWEKKTITVPASEANAEILLKTTTDNSTYTTVAMAACGNNGSDEVKQQINGHFIFDVTNTSNDKFKLATDSFGSGGTLVRGSTNDNRSSVVVIRLGDT
jgi:hypothetical protein